ncbi:MAG: hypothetical protein EBZ49_00050 [Proteobacteria bacterium]|nr:hypothetical protein [Pseudomonadota bacterium]
MASSFKQLYQTKILNWEHHVLDQHYPLNEKENRDSLKAMCKDYGAILHDAGKNLGLHEGVNYLIRQSKPDIVIGYDPDSFPNRICWDEALTKVIDENVVWSTLANPRTMGDIKARGYTEFTSNGVKLWKTKTAITNSVCAWSVPWLESVGFVSESRPFYGHLETTMFGRLKNKSWVVLPEYSESDHLRHDHDKDYALYKWAHAILRIWDGDFKSWLEAGKPHEEKIKIS